MCNSTTRAALAAPLLGVPSSAYAFRSINLGSLAGLLEQDHGPAAYCSRCDRGAVRPLAELAADGARSKDRCSVH